MIEEQDYVIAENAHYISETALSASLQGVFIGTKNYFFFIPVNTTEDIRKKKKGKPLVSTFLFRGNPVSVALEELINRKGMSLSGLEEFLLKKVKKEIPETNCCVLNDIAQFKVYSTWWGSGVLINRSSGKTGWKPFVSRFKRNKKKIKAFYQGHSKLAI